jgi:hypothetical protein
MIRTLALVPLALALALAGCARPHAAGSAPRPGLGTSWGETRDSSVRSVPFEREDPARPDALALLRYDDRAGVHAQAREPAFAAAPDDAGDSSLRVRLLDDRGVPLPQLWRAGGSYVEGRDGERYSIAIENRSDSRIEIVATVDGLDVMDGGPGSFEKRGYIVAPWASLRIDGFRRSLDEVAAFRFGSVAESYAAQKGDDANVGVIGVASFAERGSGRRGRAREAERRRHAEAFPGGFSQPPPHAW